MCIIMHLKYLSKLLLNFYEFCLEIHIFADGITIRMVYGLVIL